MSNINNYNSNSNENNNNYNSRSNSNTTSNCNFCGNSRNNINSTRNNSNATTNSNSRNNINGHKNSDNKSTKKSGQSAKTPQSRSSHFTDSDTFDYQSFLEDVLKLCYTYVTKDPSASHTDTPHEEGDNLNPDLNTRTHTRTNSATSNHTNSSSASSHHNELLEQMFLDEDIDMARASVLEAFELYLTALGIDEEDCVNNVLATMEDKLIDMELELDNLLDGATLSESVKYIIDDNVKEEDDEDENEDFFDTLFDEALLDFVRKFNPFL